MLVLARLPRRCTPRTREIVLEILKSSHPTPLTSQAIYQRAHKEYADEQVPVPEPLPGTHFRAIVESKKPQPPIPPHLDHPIRSLTYLKKRVLEDLASWGEIEKVHSMRVPTQEELQRTKERSTKKSKKNKGPKIASVSINAKGMVDQWSWSLKTSGTWNKAKEEQERIQKAIEGQKNLDPKRLEKAKKNEFLEAWGHLNTRRQRARKVKLEKEEEWASLLERGRQEGMAEAKQDAS